MWPFNRRRAEESSRESAPAPYAPARAEWRQLPPLQRMVGDQWLVNPPDSLSSRLASWQDPTYLAPLGHAVMPEGPSGAIEPAPAAPPEPRRIDLQRSGVRTELPTPVRSLQRTASDPGGSEQHRSLGDSGPIALQRIDADPPLAAPDPAPAAEGEDRPLLGDSVPQVDLPQPDAAAPTETAAIPAQSVRSESQVFSSPLGPMPSVQRSQLPDPAPIRPFGQPSEVAPSPTAPLPVQPVTPPFALQRMLIGDRASIAPPAPLPQAPVPAQPVVASLLASTDPPERRELPVVAAPPPAPLDGGRSAPAVQRSAGETAPLLGDMDLSPAEPAPSSPPAPEGLAGPLAPGPAAPDTSAPFAEPEGETAPLLGATGLAAPIVQTIRDEAPPAEPPAPLPIAPLIADRPRPRPSAESHVQRLGLGSPMSGPQPSVQRASGRSDRPLPPAGEPSGVRLPLPQFVQRLEGASSSPEVPVHSHPAGSPSSGLGLPVAVPAAFDVSVPQAAPNSSSRPARPLPPPVMVMRAVSPSVVMPVVSRSIEAPEPLYAPERGPEAPLLGSRPLAAAFAETEPAAGAPPEPRASEPGSAVAQRSTWSHMPSPVPQADLEPAPVPFGGGPASGAVAPGTGAAVQRVAQAASSVERRDAPVAQRLQVEEPLPVAAAPAPVQAMAEPAPPQFMEPVQAVVQRVAAPPQPVSVQTADAAPAAATAAPAAAGAAPAADPAALLAVLYEPLVRRLRADLRVDRERRGRLTDL
ncbi:hypothetical protein AB0K52_20670 [Glycomyces sp. NPDC049804]|uniref:hypothetical protein n=1 Tax=Glycomyces sp. NPDC049804 TaxID=3154363 RepID=UPI00341503B9